MRKSLLIFFVVLLSSVSIGMIFSGCGSRVPSEFVGTWENQINRTQKVKITIKKDGKYSLYLIERNSETFYPGEVIVISDNVVKLPSDNYIKKEKGGVTKFVTVSSVFYLGSNGAFSDTEAGLNDPYGYLRKNN